MGIAPLNLEGMEKSQMSNECVLIDELVMLEAVKKIARKRHCKIEKQYLCQKQVCIHDSISRVCRAGTQTAVS